MFGRSWAPCYSRDTRPPPEYATDPFKLCREPTATHHIPLRLTREERKVHRMVSSTLQASDYVDKVDHPNLACEKNWNRRPPAFPVNAHTRSLDVELSEEVAVFQTALEAAR
eukprot:gene6442-6214_t